jgi:hypothetical protein
MAKPRPERKQKDAPAQPQLPGVPAPSPGTTRILPTQLQLGDRLTDETGDWEIIGRQYMTNAGKDAHARVGKVGQPDVTEMRTWGAHERVSVKRAG